MVRTLKEIDKDIEDCNVRLVELAEEKKTFRQLCPHPKDFVETEVSSTDDEYGTYECSRVGFTCKLCGHSAMSKSYEVGYGKKKNDPEIIPVEFRDLAKSRPTGFSYSDWDSFNWTEMK